MCAAPDGTANTGRCFAQKKIGHLGISVRNLSLMISPFSLTMISVSSRVEKLDSAMGMLSESSALSSAANFFKMAGRLLF